MPRARAGTKLVKRRAVHSWIATIRVAASTTLATNSNWAPKCSEPVGVRTGLIAAAAETAARVSSRLRRLMTATIATTHRALAA